MKSEHRSIERCKRNQGLMLAIHYSLYQKKKWNIILQINDIWYFSWQRNSFAYGKKSALAVAQFSNIIVVIVYYFVWLSILC